MAERYFTRLRGLIGKSGFVAGQGMLFPRCNNIHMWFMSFPIDVVFIRCEKKPDGSATWRVSSVHSSVKAWRITPLMDMSGTETLELPEGRIRQCAIEAGDELCSS
ncbi:MAG: DUF192 domain-containing protein [Methylotenera sp.]|nr:DUF192 domain-containing protein [Oligoflexia bacterium]